MNIYTHTQTHTHLVAAKGVPAVPGMGERARNYR